MHGLGIASLVRTKEVTAWYARDVLVSACSVGRCSEKHKCQIQTELGGCKASDFSH